MSHALLPRTHDEFRSKAYWDSFFARRGAAFEWYGAWPDVAGAVLPRLALTGPASRVLVVGCGNSGLSADVHDAGYRDVLSVDFSEPVVAAMAAAHASARPAMRWQSMDARALAVGDAGFELVADKGLLDAMLTDAGEAATAGAAAMCDEVERVLVPGGHWMLVTLAQPHVARFIASRADRTGVWATVDVYPFVPSAAAGGGDGSGLCPFLVLLRRAHSRGSTAAPAAISVHALSHLSPDSGALPPGVTVTAAALPEEIVRAQAYFSTVCALQRGIGCRVARGGAGAAVEFGAELELWAAGVAAAGPRFCVRVMDASAKPRCGVLVVPQGREHEWLFASPEGAAQLAGDAGFGRLIVVTLGRGHAFATLADVTHELNASMRELVPPACRGDVPFVTPDGGLGARSIAAEFVSPLSGQVVVEDVAGGAPGERFRRLVFLSNAHAIQSEVRIVRTKAKAGGGGGGGGRRKSGRRKARARAAGRGGSAAAVAGTSASADDPTVADDDGGGEDDGAADPDATAGDADARPPARAVDAAAAAPRSVGECEAFDFSHLAHAYHAAVVGGLALVLPSLQAAKGGAAASFRVLVVGLGGGGLVMFLHKHFPFMDVTAVELDEVIVKVAVDWFGCSRAAPGFRVMVADGLGVVADAAVARRAAPETGLDVLVVDVDSKDLSQPLTFPPVAFVSEGFLNSARDALRPSGVLMLNISCRSPALYATIIGRLGDVFAEGDVNRVVFALPCAAATCKLPKFVQKAAAGVAACAAPWGEEPNLTEVLQGLERVSPA